MELSQSNLNAEQVKVLWAINLNGTNRPIRRAYYELAICLRGLSADLVINGKPAGNFKSADYVFSLPVNQFLSMGLNEIVVSLEPKRPDHYLAFSLNVSDLLDRQDAFKLTKDQDYDPRERFLVGLCSYPNPSESVKVINTNNKPYLNWMVNIIYEPYSTN